MENFVLNIFQATGNFRYSARIKSSGYLWTQYFTFSMFEPPHLRGSPAGARNEPSLRFHNHGKSYFQGPLLVC